MTTSDASSTAPNPTAAAYDAALAPFSEVVASVPADAWDAPSPCTEWSTRDVLGHVMNTERGWLAERGFELGEAPDLGSDPAAGWRRHVDEVSPIIHDADAMGAEYESPFGKSTVGAVFERFFVFDLVAHRWDLATGAGLGTTFTDDELETIEAGIEFFGPHLHADGVCGPAVPVADDADRQTRLLGELGRAA